MGRMMARSNGAHQEVCASRCSRRISSATASETRASGPTVADTQVPVSSNAASVSTMARETKASSSKGRGGGTPLLVHLGTRRHPRGDAKSRLLRRRELPKEWPCATTVEDSRDSRRSITGHAASGTGRAMARSNGVRQEMCACRKCHRASPTMGTETRASGARQWPAQPYR